MVLGWFKNDYYKYPEGTHPWEKVRYFTQAGIMGGVLTGLYDIHLLSAAKTVKHSANIMAYWVVPITSMCAVYSTTFYLSTNIRNKDDRLNCIPAVLSIAPIFHKWQKVPYHVTVAVTGLALIAALVHEHMRLVGRHVVPREFHMPREYKLDCEW